MTEAERLERILEQYKFIEPVPAAGRMGMIRSRPKILKSALKELGEYSVWYALVLFILLKIRGFGVKISLAAAKIFAAAAAIISAGIIVSGGYAIVNYSKVLGVMFNSSDNSALEKSNETIEAESSTDAKEESPADQPAKQENAPVYEILLYNGKIYHGVIRSRGQVYKVSTPSGQISIPSKQIRMIKRVQ